jgi:hypothetical protein
MCGYDKGESAEHIAADVRCGLKHLHSGSSPSQAQATVFTAFVLHKMQGRSATWHAQIILRRKSKVSDSRPGYRVVLCFVAVSVFLGKKIYAGHPGERPA